MRTWSDPYAAAFSSSGFRRDVLEPLSARFAEQGEVDIDIDIGLLRTNSLAWALSHQADRAFSANLIYLAIGLAALVRPR
jgi:hypothetical protein